MLKMLLTWCNINHFEKYSSSFYSVDYRNFACVYVYLCQLYICFQLIKCNDIDIGVMLRDGSSLFFPAQVEPKHIFFGPGLARATENIPGAFTGQKIVYLSLL